MPPKRPKDEEPEFDMEEDNNDEGFEVDMDVIERIAKALESIAKVLVDREAKFASRPPKKDFGDRPQRSFGSRDSDERGSFSKPGYGEKTFRKGPGLGYSDRDKPAGRSAPRKDYGDRPDRAGDDRGDRGGKPMGRPGAGRPPGKPPTGRR